MSGGGAETGTVTIKVMVGSESSRHPRDKSGVCSSGGRVQRESDGVDRIGKDGGREAEMTRKTRDDQMEMIAPNVNGAGHGCTHPLGWRWKRYGWMRSGSISPATRK